MTIDLLCISGLQELFNTTFKHSNKICVQTKVLVPFRTIIVLFDGLKPAVGTHKGFEILFIYNVKSKHTNQLTN